MLERFRRWKINWVTRQTVPHINDTLCEKKLMTTIIIFIVHFDSSSRTWRWWRRLSSLPSTTRAPTAPSTCTRLVTTNNRIRPFTRHVDFAARKLHQFSAAVWRFFRQIIVFSSLVKIWFAVSTRNFVGVHFTVLRKNSIWARAFVKSNLYSLKCWSHVEASIIFCRSSVSITIYKILNTTQPSYLYDLISIQPPHRHNTLFTLCHSHQTIIITQSNSSILPTCFTSYLSEQRHEKLVARHWECPRQSSYICDNQQINATCLLKFLQLTFGILLSVPLMSLNLARKDSTNLRTWC